MWSALPDTPTDEYGNDTATPCWLWSARTSKEFDLKYFEGGDYLKAVEKKTSPKRSLRSADPNDQFYRAGSFAEAAVFFASCFIPEHHTPVSGDQHVI